MGFDSTGVCDLGGKVYCVGGWNGQYGMKKCNVFDPVTTEWSDIAPLNFGTTTLKEKSQKNRIDKETN